MKKFTLELIVYLTITIGALIMLMPFLWMLDTSFKLQSEVLTWPPKWITKNVFTSRNLKVFVDFSKKGDLNFENLTLNEIMNLSLIEQEKEKENSLMLKIFDDPPIRGKLHISILSPDGSNAKFAKVVTESDKKRLLNILQANKPIPEDVNTKLARLIETSSSTIDLIGKLFEEFFHSEDSIFNRKKFVDSSGNTINNVLNKLNNYEKKILNHRILRINKNDSSELKAEKEFLKVAIKNYMITKRRALFLIKNELHDYKKGLHSILKLNEINELLQRFSKIPNIDQYVDKNKLQLLKVDILLNFIKRNFDIPIEEWKNLLSLFIDFHEFFKSIQKNRLESNILVVAYKTDSEITKDFVSRLEKIDLPDYVMKKTLKLFKENRSKFLSEFINWINEIAIAKLEGVVAKDYIRDFIDKLGKITSVFRDLNIENSQKRVLLETLFNYSFDNRDIPEVLKNKLISLLGNNQYKLLIRNMNNLSKVITKRTNKEKVLHVLEERLELIEYLKTINAVYNRATTQLNIIKGPKIIKDVSKEGDDTLRITFDKVRSFWFEDESFKMKAEFSFKETLLNLFQNYLDAWKAAPFSRYYFNTIFVSLTTTVLEIIFASMAAFAFAKLNFFGKNIIFLLFLSTMMVPGEVLLVPNYITLAKLGWLDTYYALIIPWTVSVFAIFLIRQHFLALPNELYDAAKMDGCSDWKFLWEIMVPLSKPVIITAALLKFVSSWNSFLWVLIVTKSPEIRTLPVGLLNFSSEVGTLYNQLMAASTFSVLPVIIVFLFAQKYFIRGISRTGLK